jgi:MFS family permease
MRAGVLLASACSLSIALAARTWWALPLLLVVGGVANGAIQPAANLLLARRVDTARQGFAFGAKQAAIPLSTLIAGLAVPAVALTVGCHYAFALATALGLAVALMLPGRPAPTRPSGAGRPKDGSTTGDPIPRTASSITVTLVVLTGAMALGSAAANSLGTFVVPGAVRAGFQPGTAGFLAALGSASGLSARLMAGLRADRRGRNHLRAVAYMLAAGALGYLGLAAGLRPLDVLAVVVAFAAGWGWPGLFNFAVVRSHSHQPAWATGITQTGAYLGGTIGPFVFGVVAEHASYRAAWGMDALLALCAAGGMLVAREILHRRRALIGIEPLDA